MVVGFDVEVEEARVDEEGSSWAMTVRVDEVEEEFSMDVAFVNALKELPGVPCLNTDF